MSATTTHRVRSGAHYATEAATGDLYVSGAGQPVIDAHVTRRGLIVHWHVTAGDTELAFGHTFTRTGALVEARAAARRRDVVARARQAVA